MKQHQKWLNETLSKEVADKFEAKTQNVTTIDEALITISKLSWRGALECFYQVAEHLSPTNCDIIDEELKE